MKPLHELSQHQKILMHICHNRQQEWFLPFHFMGDTMGDLFVGYEASARLSELAKDYPDMMDSQREGKYIRRRVRFESIDQWLHLLSKDLRYVFHRAGLTKNVPRPEHHESKSEQPTPPENPKNGSLVKKYNVPCHRKLCDNKVEVEAGFGHNPGKVYCSAECRELERKHK